MDNNILITGSNGFVAKHLSKYINKMGESVYGIDLQEESVLNFIKYKKIDICRGS